MTSKEIEELAGHRQVPAWVVKLVSDAVAIEREACADVAENWRCNGMPRTILAEQIRAREKNT
jgi:hypothetical protein